MKHVKGITRKPLAAQSNFQAKLNFMLDAIDSGTGYWADKFWNGRL